MLLDILCCKWSQQNTAVGESVKVILDFLNDVCPLHKISYWSYASKGKRKCDRAAKSRATNSISKWSSREMLYICLLRLRTGFTIKTLSVLLSTPDKPIKGTAVRDIFTTFIQSKYKIFREMEDVMFPYHFPPSIPGSRRWWSPLAIQSLTRVINSWRLPLCFDPLHFNQRQRLSWSTV